MTYAVIEDVAGGDWDTYSRITEEIGGDAIAGLVLLASGVADTGVRVISVWSAEDDYRTFVTERLSPAAQGATGTAANGGRSVTSAIDVRHLVHGRP